MLYGFGSMIEKGIIKKPNLDITTSVAQCGFNLTDNESLVRFAHLISESTTNVDFYGTFRWIWEDYLLLNNLSISAKLTNANVMDFWRFNEPFTTALKGKKVLVVSPFAELIEKQYINRDKIFKNKNWLPEFSLITFKSIQTIAGTRDDRFSNWFDAYEYMKNEIAKIDFDIALLGCGAYGMPLSSSIRRMNKQVIYMGGVIQILFGIKGKRWDSIPEVSSLYNEYWVYPDSKDKPKNSEIVEGGCYW